MLLLCNSRVHAVIAQDRVKGLVIIDLGSKARLHTWRRRLALAVVDVGIGSFGNVD